MPKPTPRESVLWRARGEVELRADDAPLERERQRVGLPLQVPHERLVELAQQVGAEAHLDDLLLARLEVARVGVKLKRRRRAVVGRERVVAVDVAVVLEHDLVPVLRVDVDVADVEALVEPRRLRPEAHALQLERQPRLAAGELAVGGERDLAGGGRAEGDRELAVRVGEDLAARRVDREDRVLEDERVLLDEAARRARTCAAAWPVGLLVEAHEGVQAVGLVLARGAVRLPREAHLDVRPVVQLERRLREQRDVARLEHEQRALEAHLDVGGGAGEARVAALARVVLDEQLLGVLAPRLRLEPERQLHRLARRSMPSEGSTENGGGTDSEKRPSALPVLRSRKASVALARTGCRPKSTPSGNSKHARGPRAEIITTNFSRSERHTSSHE